MQELVGVDAARKPEISNELDRLEAVVFELEEHIDRLKTRLGPVLQPEPPVPTTNPNAKGLMEAVSTPLALQLNGQRARVREMCSTIQSILSRLEI